MKINYFQILLIDVTFYPNMFEIWHSGYKNKIKKNIIVTGG